MKNYFLSNSRLFFIGNSGNEFNSKWLGLSSLQKHYIDYVSVRTGSTWLSGKPLGFSEKNSKAVFKYKDSTLEFFFDPDFVIRAKTSAKTEVEIGVNIRDIYSNESEALKITKGRNLISLNGLKLTFKNLVFEKYFYKTHFPGQQTNRHNFFEAPQKCMVLVFSGGKNPEIRMKLNGMKKIQGLKKYYFENTGFIAGLPLFPQLWARDFCICCPALLKSGLKKEVKSTLKILEKFQHSSGEIPMKIQDSKPVYGSIDSTPLYIISCLELKDSSFNKSVKKALASYNPFKKGYTWMDTIERTGLPVEVASFWYRAFKLASSRFKNRIYRTRKKQLKDIVSRYNFNDSLPDRGIITANPLFMLLYADIDKKKAVKILEKLETPAFLTKEGVRAYSSENPDFNPDSYHKGAVWTYLTNLLILAELKYKRKKTAKKLIELQKKVFENDFSEIPEKGCFFQLWSEALFRYILGLF